MSSATIARVLTWLCHYSLALVFISSAAYKIKSPASLKNYLAPLFHSASRLVGYGVIAAELCLALVLVFWDNIAASWLALAVLVTLTGSYAMRFSVADGVRCACWGSSGESRDVPPLREAVLPPLIVALRNGVLTGVASVSIILSSVPKIELVKLLAAVIASILTAQLIVSLGMAISILLKRHTLRADAKEHPMVAVYAPRWVRVRGCRTFEIDEQRRVVHQ